MTSNQRLRCLRKAEIACLGNENGDTAGGDRVEEAARRACIAAMGETKGGVEHTDRLRLCRLRTRHDGRAHAIGAVNSMSHAIACLP
eukprot:5088451-Prymnesium_polylepis.1